MYICHGISQGAGYSGSRLNMLYSEVKSIILLIWFIVDVMYIARIYIRSVLVSYLARYLQQAAHSTSGSRRVGGEPRSVSWTIKYM